MHNVEPSLTTAEGTPLLTLSAWVTLHVHDTLGDSSGGAGPSGTSLLGMCLCVCVVCMRCV